MKRPTCPIRRGGDSGCHRCRGVRLARGVGPEHAAPIQLLPHPLRASGGSGRSERGQVPLERPALREGARRIANHPDRTGRMGPSERASDGRPRVHDPRPCEDSALLTPPLVGLRVAAVPERAATPPIKHRQPAMPEMNRQDTSSPVERHRQISRTRPRAAHRARALARDTPGVTPASPRGSRPALSVSSPPVHHRLIKRGRPWRVHPVAGSGVKRRRARSER